MLLSEGWLCLITFLISFANLNKRAQGGQRVAGMITKEKLILREGFV